MSIEFIALASSALALVALMVIISGSAGTLSSDIDGNHDRVDTDPGT